MLKKASRGFGLMIILLFLVIAPLDTAGAVAPGGFLTCDGTDCSFCNLVDLVNIIIVWLFGIIFLIFAFLMAIAGWGLVTSGGNTSALEDAKSKFKNAIVGLIIVMAAWLLVDTIMRGLVGGGSVVDSSGNPVPEGEISGWGPWMKVKCQTQTLPVQFVDLNTGSNPDGTVSEKSADPNAPVNTATTSGACNIPALSPITDPSAIKMEQGQTIVFNNPTLKKCVDKFIGEVGGKVNSAYRPQSYQDHLWEIKDRWCTKGLKNNTDPSCSALKTAVSGEVTKHFGSNWSCGAVAKTSNHSSNSAVDIGGIDHASVKSIADKHCLVWKNFKGDPWHYDLKGGCTCD